MNTETQVSPGEETQNPAPEVANETPEVAAPEAVETAQTPSEDADDGDKSLKRMQRRIDRRTADLYRERAERERLAQELESLRSQAQPQEGQIDAQTIEQKALEIARRAQVADKSNSVYQSGKKSFPDFDNALTTVIAEAGPLIDRSGFPTPLGEAVLDAEKPEALIHYLGKNPEVAEELRGLTPTQLARRLVRIEDQMKAKPKVSGAPTPLKPVKPAASNDMPSDDDDVNTWMKKERARLAAKHR